VNAPSTGSVKISILTPAYNAERYLPQLLSSVAEQSYRNFEHIVINDGSTDGTEDILRAFDHVTVIAQENQGQCTTQNELLLRATGDVVVIICADDYFADEDVLRRVANAFEHDIDVVVGRTPRFVEGAPPYFVRPDIPLWLGLRIVGSYLTIQHCSVFVRRQLLLEQHLFFDSSYTLCGDWDWLRRLFSISPKVRRVSADLGVWRQHPQQTSAIALHGASENARLLREVDGRLWVHRLLRRVCTAYALGAHVAALVLQHGPGGVRLRLQDRARKRRELTAQMS
jgi:glycosyltransferase involved in cell wall biosynthesis